MENLILGLFIGIPAALLVGSMIAWYRTNNEYKIEES